MKGFNKIAVGFFLLALPTLVFSQEGRLKYADKMYDQKSYHYASEGYEDVLARKTDSATVAVRLADSYDKIGNVQKAADWYQYLKRNNTISKDQHLRLALLERQLENYSSSEELLASFSSKFGENDVADNVLKSQVSVSELAADKGWFEIKEQNVNSKFSEIGTHFIDENTVILASSKRRNWVVGHIDSWSGDYFYNMYKAKVDENGMIGKTKRMKSDAHTKFHDGPSTYCKKTGYVYFTRNDFTDGNRGGDLNGTTHLKIYRAKLDGNKLVDAQELSINNSEYSTAHPALSMDGERLYFSSNRAGGFGGMDLYYVNLDKNGLPVGEPVNLGSKVNTSEDEVFPFVNTTENILFFSSEGHFGLGGLDVFVAKLDKSGNAKNIENLGSPINSPYDDFSFANNSSQQKGYFSSNRPNGAGSDDIYGFVQKVAIKNSATLKGNARDLLTDTALEGTSVSIIDSKGNRIETVQTQADGYYEFSISEMDGDFELVAEKDNYVTAKQTVKYDEAKEEYNQDADLMPILNYHFEGIVQDMDSKAALSGVSITMIDAKTKNEFEKSTTNAEGTFASSTLPYGYKETAGYTFRFEKKGYVSTTAKVSKVLDREEVIYISDQLAIDMKKITVGKTDLNEVVDIAPIFFDFNKFDIREDAAKELDKVVAIMQDNPGMIIELGSHTDSRGSAAYNRTLSDKRAKASANYIISKGIDKSRISGKGYGLSRLKYSNAEINKVKTEEEKEALHEKNRRTEFIIVRMK